MSAVAIGAATKQRRARTGLAGVLVASAASIVAYTAQSLALSGERPDNLALYSVAFTGLALAGWFAIRKLARGTDPILYPTAVMIGGPRVRIPKLCRKVPPGMPLPEGNSPLKSPSRRLPAAS